MEFLPLIGIVLLFWLFIIRPQSRRQKELRSMQSALSVGDEVMLTSGIFGRVEEIADDHLVVAIADGVGVKIAKGAIGSKIAPETHDEHDEDDADGADERIDETDDQGTDPDRPQGS